MGLCAMAVFHAREVISGCRLLTMPCQNFNIANIHKFDRLSLLAHQQISRVIRSANDMKYVI